MVESWHISATFLFSSSCIHPQKTRCVYLQGFTYKVFLVFVPFSLSSPLFQPKCSGCLMLLSRMLAGAFPACPSAPPGNTSPACRAAGVIPIYSAGSKNRTPRQAAMGAGKINRATEFELSCCNVSFHASFKEGSLWAAAWQGWKSSQHHPIFSSLLSELFLSLTKLYLLFLTP